MKAATKILFLDDEGEKFFGEGPARLLRGVEQTGSLRSAALSMEMAYTKALKLVKHAEAALGYPLILRTAGGKDGGGSRLTEEGKAFLKQYEAYRDACLEANRKLFRAFFPQLPFEKAGCVIMASGLGQRFGGNKLLADFRGEPLICSILETTDGLFEKRAVVTRHEAVAAICRERNIPVVLHDLPHRSDTVRLGLEAVGDVDRCLFCPGDQPLLRRETVISLLQHGEDAPEKIWRPCRDDIPGSPVLFPAWTFPELKSLPEGKGGGWLIRKYPEKTAHLQVEDPAELMDADTPEALEQLRQLYDRRNP